MSRKAAPAAAPVPPDALLSTLALLQLVAGPEMMAAAVPLLRERMALTPEKLSALLELTLNPYRFVKKGEEAGLRGIHEETLKSYKEEKLLPEFIGANVPVAIQFPGRISG